MPLGVNRISMDHINEVKDDNRLVNLRLATDEQNKRNRGKLKNNTSGFKGVSWAKRDKCWVAKISFGGRGFYLGGFDTPEEAYSAYRLAAAKYHGEFANTGVM